MYQFKPLKQNRIYEEVMGQLKEAILSGSYKTGEKLPSEQELTELFQVSRGVVREAIRALEITGFVTTRQGPAGGAFVNELSFEYVENAFMDLFLSNRVTIPELAYVRRLIEPDVARLATENITEEGRLSLSRIQDNELLNSKTIPERISINAGVHWILAEMCGNRFLEAIMKSLLNMTREMADAVEPEHYNRLQKPGEHQKIIDAVLKGDCEEAFNAMTEHLELFYDELILMEKAYRKKLSSVKIDNSTTE